MKNLVLGTIVSLTIPVFTGSFRNAKFSHDIEIKKAIVVREVYGERNKHWITFEILESDDKDYPVGSKKRMQGKNAYANCQIMSQPENVKELTADKNEAKSLNELTCGW